MVDAELGNDMMELARLMVTSVVDHPDAVVISAEAGAWLLKLKVTTAPGDVGQVIGKQGRTARAMRTILGAAATARGITCDLDIVEPAGERR